MNVHGPWILFVLKVIFSEPLTSPFFAAPQDPFAPTSMGHENPLKSQYTLV